MKGQIYDPPCSSGCEPLCKMCGRRTFFYLWEVDRDVPRGMFLCEACDQLIIDETDLKYGADNRLAVTRFLE